MQEIDLVRRLQELNKKGFAGKLKATSGEIDWAAILAHLNWDLYAPLEVFMKDRYPKSFPHRLQAETVYKSGKMIGVRVKIGKLDQEYITGYVPRRLYRVPIRSNVRYRSAHGVQQDNGGSEKTLIGVQDPAMFKKALPEPTSPDGTQQHGNWSDRIATSVQGFCLKDHKMVQMKNPFLTTLSNGRVATKGACPICGCTVTRMGDALSPRDRAGGNPSQSVPKQRTASRTPGNINQAVRNVNTGSTSTGCTVFGCALIIVIFVIGLAVIKAGYDAVSGLFAAPSLTPTPYMDVFATTEAQTAVAVADIPTEPPLQIEFPPVPTDTPEVPHYPGDIVSADDWSFTVGKIASTKEIEWTEIGNTETASGLYWIIYFTVQNNKNETRSLNSDFNFTLKDTYGATYDEKSSGGTDIRYVEYAKINGHNSLDKAIAPRASTHPLLIFDVAPDAKPRTLTIRVGGFLGLGADVIHFDLGR